jgi:hypothetical protein
VIVYRQIKLRCGLLYFEIGRKMFVRSVPAVTEMFFSTSVSPLMWRTDWKTTGVASWQLHWQSVRCQRLCVPVKQHDTALCAYSAGICFHNQGNQNSSTGCAENTNTDSSCCSWFILRSFPQDKAERATAFLMFWRRTADDRRRPLRWGMCANIDRNSRREDHFGGPGGKHLQ